MSMLTVETEVKGKKELSENLNQAIILCHIKTKNFN